MQGKKREGESNIMFMIRQGLTAGFAASIGETITIPMDTVKVRLQMQNTAKLEGTGRKPRYNGIIGTTKTIISEEGARALWNGLTPGVHRQLIFSGLRVSLYTPVRNFICGPLKEGENPLLYQKMMAGIITGAIGITVANPTDVVKVRLQNQRKSVSGQVIETLSGSQPGKTVYRGTLHCYQHILATEGIMGLWASWGANVVRNSVINCCELASYDQYKQMLIESGKFGDGYPVTIISAFGAGFTACCFGSPLDVLTTRQMNNPGKYTGPTHVIADTIKEGGLKALYKGFLPNVMRLGSYNVVLWVTVETIKNHMG